MEGASTRQAGGWSYYWLTHSLQKVSPSQALAAMQSTRLAKQSSIPLCWRLGFADASMCRLGGPACETLISPFLSFSSGWSKSFFWGGMRSPVHTKLDSPLDKFHSCQLKLLLSSHLLLVFWFRCFVQGILTRTSPHSHGPNDHHPAYKSLFSTPRKEQQTLFVPQPSHFRSPSLAARVR